MLTTRYQLSVFLLLNDPGEKASKIYGGVRAELERKGLVIGAMDILIAAHAISLDLILVTNNLKEFARIPNLRLENWVE